MKYAAVKYAAVNAAVPGMRRFRRSSVSLLIVLMALCLLLCSCSGAPATEGSVPGETGAGVEDQPAAEPADTDQPAAGPAAEQPGGCQKISAEEARQMMEGTQDYILVDVRTEEEYKEAHIEGAVLIPVDVIGARAAEELPDMDAVIFVYCRSGVRSAQAAETLAGLGYTQVFDMGGINGWPYGTVSG